MKYKPVDVADEFGDQTLSCGKCKKPIIFPIVSRWGRFIFDQKPTHCKYCGAEINWGKEGDENGI